MWTEQKWQKGKRIITGRWEYRWHSDSFVVFLDAKDPITGNERRLEVCNDTPEWNGWKMIKSQSKG